MLRIDDHERVRTLTLDRPDALNAFNEELYDATTVALRDAASDPAVAVVVLTGSGRAFSAGTDLLEMAARSADPESFLAGTWGFGGLLDTLADFPKPLICAVNGLGLGIGMTILGYADLVVMSTEARLRCPFSSLGVAPEAASSYLFPRLLGHQRAAWVLMSAEWFSAEQCLEMGLAMEVCGPDELLATAGRYAATLAVMPVSSLVETKALIMAPIRAEIEAARQRENAAFGRLMGAPANVEALTAFAEKRTPDFTNL